MDTATTQPASSSLPTTTDLEAQVAELAEALQKEQSKLARWKEKAQSGVDELRQRILELSAEVERTTSEREALRAKLEICMAAKEQQTTVCASSLPACRTCTVFVDTYLDTLRDAVDVLVRDKVEAVACASLSTSGLASSSTRADFDVYKRRMETTLRLQSKNNEALQHQVQELQAMLTKSDAALQERERSLQAGNATVSMLEQRLKDALQAQASLEEQKNSAASGPNMEELNLLEERYEAALERQRSEYTARENAIFSQHTQEIQRLTAQHDAEVQELQRDWQRRLQMAVDEAAQQQKKTQMADAASTLGSSDRQSLAARDVAYEQLLREHETLKVQYQALQTELRALKATTHAGTVSSSIASVPNDGAETLTLPGNLADAHIALQSQFATIQQLSQQLWQTKREALDMKRRASAQAQTSAVSGPPPPLTPQQFEYLRGVVVNVLCFHRDDHLVMNLLPVLSTLLQMTPADLRQICTANPKWTVK